MKTPRLRIFYATIFTLLLLIETYIALYIHDRFIRPYIGDVLVVIVLYSFIRIFIPTAIKRLLPLYIFLFAALIEVLQYFDLPALLGLSGNKLAGIILGSTFDWKDIACYGVGCLVLWAYESWSNNK